MFVSWARYLLLPYARHRQRCLLTGTSYWEEPHSLVPPRGEGRIHTFARRDFGAHVERVFSTVPNFIVLWYVCGGSGVVAQRACDGLPPACCASIASIPCL